MADFAERFGSKLEHSCRLVKDRKIVRELSDRQLEDAGIDRWQICPARPALEIEASLITANLMGLR
jgi:hypothetical protein